MSTKNFKTFGTNNTERVGVYDLNSYKHYVGASKWLKSGSQAEFLSPGNYSWVCPPGVTSVSVVCVGGGGGGGAGWANSGGSGGGLGYKNNISVTPGQSYAVFVGQAGNRGANHGQDSYFIDINTVGGRGGAGQAQNTGTLGNYVGDGGGIGGSSNGWNGGGAGGYAGNGGNNNQDAQAQGGGGAGGKAYSSTYGTGAGGGVGIYGLRTDYNASAGKGYGSNTGRGGTPNNASSPFTGGGGQGGSTRTGIISNELTGYSGCNGENNSGYANNGAQTHGGYPGGGAGGSGTSNGGGRGGDGAVRIMWAGEGQTRSYPSTNCEDVQ